MKNRKEAEPFRCGGHDIAGMDEKTAKRLGFSFPQVHLQREEMVRFAEAVKKEQGNRFCVLPFCHTVEGEALGGNINYGDARFGPRAGKAVCCRAEEVLALPPIDYSAGRIREGLDACAELTRKGEAVIFNMSGPLTILNVLMETEDVFRLLTDLKREDGAAQHVFWKLKEELLRFAEKIIEAGAVGISYADPLCGRDIIGPQLNELLTEQFSLPFLFAIASLLRRKAKEQQKTPPFFFLCPRLLPEAACGMLRAADAEQIFVSGGCIKSLLCGEGLQVGEVIK